MISPTIAAIETATISLPANGALTVHGARGTHGSSTFVLVRVTTSDGVAGYGEISATALWSGEDDVTATHMVRDVFRPALVGLPLAPVDALGNVMSKLVAGNPFTKAGVNMALWDALGRTLDVPVAMLLGGPFRTRVPIKLSLSGDADALAASHEEATRRGFSRFKVKVGLKPDDDVARFALARSLVGADGFLGADANGGWSRLDAAAVIPRLAEHGVAFVEQPVAPSDLEGLADLRRFGVPVLADESVFSLGDAARVARLAAADAVSLYVGKSGGLAEVVFAARMLAAFGIGSIIGSNGEMGVGAAAQIHVACACEELASIPSDIIGHHYYDADMLVTPVPIDGTWATLPPGPGLGVEPNEEAIRQLA